MPDAQPARPLRVAICAPYDLGRAGGVNSHIRSQAAALRQLGHEVTVFGASSAPLDNGELALSGCLSLVIGGTETGMGFDPRAERRVAALMQRGRFDIVHMHEPLTPLLPWFVLWHASAPIVATFHTHREEGHRLYARFRWLLAPLLRRVRTRLAVSESARRTVARIFPGDYLVVPNGIDVERFSRPRPRPPEMPCTHRHVLYVGRLEPRKGVDVLLRAMPAVQAVARDVHLTIVGDGPDRARLEEAAARAQVSATFVGRVEDSTLPGYYQAADIVCSPALGGESFGIVLLEGMASGRAVVASRIDGYVDLTQGTDCVRLVRPGDADALADALLALLGDERLRHAMGERGAIAAHGYAWPAVARRLEAIYRHAVQ